MRAIASMLVSTALSMLLAAGASAAQELTVMDGFTARVQSPWPDTLSRGYAPVFVELRNETDQVVDAEVEVGSAYRIYDQPDCVARTTVRVGVGEQRRLELLAPFHRTYNRPSSVSVKVGTTWANSSLSTGSATVDPSVRLVAWVTPTALPAGTVERVADALEQAEAKLGALPAPLPPPPTHLHPGVGYVGVPGTGSGPTWSVFEVLPGQLSTRAAAWSAVDAIVLDGSAGAAALAGLALEGVLSHVRQGGLLVVLGERDVLTALGIEAALEPRFVLPKTGTVGETSRLGLGRVTWLGRDADLVGGDAEHQTLVSDVQPVHLYNTREGVFQPGTAAALETYDFLWIPGVAELPVRVFVLLLLVFALVIGPVNFIALKRMGRPGLLLVTIPLISLVASLGILGIGIFNQGLDVKGAVHSFTLLDQREGRAVTLSRLALMPGLATDDLLPARGTTVHTTAYIGESSRELAVEHGDGLRLAGGWAPVRTTTNLFVSSDAPARSRVELRRDGDGFELVNTLETEILAFHATDAAGLFYVLAEGASVAPGGKARLARAATASIDLGDNSLAARASSLPSTYLARVARNPFLDTLGLAPNFKAESHLIEGILPSDEALWSK